jgi:hypothetical protein
MAKYIIFLSLAFLQYSCSSFKDGVIQFRKENTVVFNENELNVLCIKKYMENATNACDTDTIIHVYYELSYFDQDILNYNNLRKINRKAKPKSKDKIELFLFLFYYICNKNIYFSLIWEDYQYEFAPVIVIPETKDLIGHVRHDDGSVYRFVYRLIGDRIFDQGIYELISEGSIDNN